MSEPEPPKAESPKAEPAAGPVASPAAKPCPICGKTRDAKYTPFCSRRCADVDLYRWLKGSYSIPGVAKPGEDSGDAGED